MILAENEILRELALKRIKITPFLKKQVGPGSVDLTLSDEFRIYKDTKKPIALVEKINYKTITKKIIAKKGLVIQPGEFILGMTKEQINLPSNIAAWMQGRSRFARAGLMVHATAPFIQPGINNRQVLEMYNAGPVPLLLKPGERICELILERCDGHARYKGKFKKQTL